MAIAGFGMMCAHHWSGPSPHPGPGLPTRLPGAPTVNMPYRPPQTQTNRPHGHRGRAWAFASSAGLRHLYQWCAGKSGRQLDPDRGSGLPTVRSPRCAHEQLDTTAVRARGSEESSFGAARDTDRVLGPHVQAVAATAWAFAPALAAGAVPRRLDRSVPHGHNAFGPKPSATPPGCRTGTRHPSHHTRRKPAHDVE